MQFMATLFSSGSHHHHSPAISITDGQTVTQLGLIEGTSEVTWWLSGAGLQGAGLFGHRFGEWVTASDQLPALVTFHIPHPHTHTARLGALRTYQSKRLTHSWGKHGVSVPC